MWGLEYPLLFGLPSGKLELSEGQTRCVFPFRTRDEGEAHFADWLQTLRRWKGLDSVPAARRDGRTLVAEAAGFTFTRYPLPIEVHVPFDGETFITFLETPWRRDLWPGQPPGLETGGEWFGPHGDIRMIVWGVLEACSKRHGGKHSSWVDTVISDTASVAPDAVYYAKGRRGVMIEGDYFQGPPDLIAEVMSPASRAFDRGPRKEAYRRAGVPHLWLLDPALETVEVYELAGAEYRLVATHATGSKYGCPLFPGEVFSADGMFATQEKRNGRAPWRPKDPEPIPPWLIPADQPLGLEHLMLLGHPDRRPEIWNNRAHCVLPFGSAEEARARFARFVEEAGRWEGVAVPRADVVGDDTERAEVGRFALTRTGRHVRLDVAVDARKYRELLAVWARRGVWDWGEE